MSVRLHPLRWAAAFAVVLLALGVWALSQAAHFLEGPAEQPVYADLLVALGGDGGERGLTVARLYAAGMAPRVLIAGLETSPSAVRRAYQHWRVQVLVEAGVPMELLEFDTGSGNSWDEAMNTRRLMEARGLRRVLVVSDPSHMRRLSWTWRRVFEGSGLEFVLVSTAPPYWKPEVWWRDEKSGQAVIVEYIKLGYYLARY